MTGTQPVRVSGKALIIAGGRLLCIHKRDEFEEYYILPGGGQAPGATLPEALRRECREELGVEVRVGPLRFVRDDIGRNHAFADTDGQRHRHALDVIFECALAPGALPRIGPVPDAGQLGVDWVEVGRLRVARCHPAALADPLAVRAGAAPIYLGGVN